MSDNTQMVIGWREWAALPTLGLPAIKTKIDTGARTSALHAFSTDAYVHNGVDMVRFLIHPIQNDLDFFVECNAPIIDQRDVTDSGGHKEKRFVIASDVVIGEHSWPIELTLTNRDTMLFRMLLGRRAMAGRAVVKPGESFLNGKLRARNLYGLSKEKTK